MFRAVTHSRRSFTIQQLAKSRNSRY
jgi:hypothetical protein